MGMHNQISKDLQDRRYVNKINESFIVHESRIFLGDTSVAFNSGNRDSFYFAHDEA